MTELEKIDAAVDEFAEAMKQRLHEKYEQGFRGWDDPAYFTKMQLWHRVKSWVNDETKGVIQHIDKAVDIANIMMFLRHRTQPKR